MSIIFYTYPKCGTCRKAASWLKEHNVSVEPVDITLNPPSKELLADVLKVSGISINKLFNTSGVKYRELGLKDVIPTKSQDELLELLSSDGKLIKRPLLFNGDKATVGFNEEVFEKVWL
ncbi:arsenate reductase family protein [Bacillus sp. EAC]|uniref:arsenate reductase family protein n=1 Tax=Bacillus sp. EAC TaxID=1978338 RepID=UPI000B4404C1|nr:arsenate reductase family protein [Bacillus sp. EAC]